MSVRKRLNITQYQLAKDSGLSEKYLNLLEHGAYDPRASTILRISRAMKVSAGLILDEQERLEAESVFTEAEEPE